MNITMKNHEDISSQEVTDAILWMVSFFSVKGRNILFNILLIACLPFVLVFFSCVMIYFNKKLIKALEYWKSTPIETEEQYNVLMKMRNSTINAKARKRLLKKPSEIPFYFRPLFKIMITNTNIMAETHDVLSEKLFLMPKGVTDEQIKEAAILNKGIEDLFGDDEDEYDYAKDFALEQMKFTERK